MKFRNQLGQAFSSLLLFGFLGNSEIRAQEHIACYQGQLAPDQPETRGFGTAIARAGDWFVVGAPYDDEKGPYSGAIYVFHREDGEWIQTQKLFASDAESFPDQQFGHVISMSEDFIAVGTPYFSYYWDGIRSEQVYVFQRNGDQWVEQARLLPDDHLAIDGFGSEVSIVGDRLLAGAPEHFHPDEPCCARGSVYVFRFVEGFWVQESELLPPDSQAYEFGRTVAFKNDIAVIGAPHSYNQNSSFQYGRAYVYRLTNSSWNFESVLLPGGEETVTAFGQSLAIDQNRILVGAPDDYVYSRPSYASAYVFVYEQGNWIREARLLPSDMEQVGNFGQSVSLSGEIAMIADPRFGEKDSYLYPSGFVGAVFSFQREGGLWTEKSTITPPITFPYLSMYYQFGSSFHLSEDELFIGDPQISFSGMPGVIFRYHVEQNCFPDCNANGQDDFLDVIFGVSEDINHNQLPDECELPFRIVSSNPPNGLIDARQPTDSMGNYSGGINWLHLQFNSAGLGMIPEEWSVTEIGGDGMAPVIMFTQVGSSGEVYLQLSSNIDLLAWTIFTHIPTGESVRIGYLPGDVNGDGTSTPHDILALLNIMLRVTPFDQSREYFLDINRNGLFEPYDILRLIDLLLGNGVYDSYFYQSLPE